MPASATKREEVAERRAQVLRLRAAGFTYRQIAKQLQMKGESAVAMDLIRALEQARLNFQQEAKYYVQIELERLDQMERTVQQVVSRATVALQNQASGLPGANDLGMPPDAALLQATDRLLRIAQRRAALLGLDSDGRSPEQADDPVDELKARRDRKLAAGR